MYNLKILKINYKPPDMFNLGYNKIFSKVQKVTIQNTLMQNPEKFLFIVEIEWKKDPDNNFVKEFVFIEDSKELITIDHRSICLVGGKIPKEHTEILQQLSYNFNCFLEFPIIMEKNSISGNIVGDQKDLNKFIDFIKSWGADFKIISIKKYYPSGSGILSALTKRQLMCLENALEKGYFDYPKKSDSRKIAENLDITHSTFIEHIKKAEKVIISNLLRK